MTTIPLSPRVKEFIFMPNEFLFNEIRKVYGYRCHDCCIRIIIECVVYQQWKHNPRIEN